VTIAFERPLPTRTPEFEDLEGTLRLLLDQAGRLGLLDDRALGDGDWDTGRSPAEAALLRLLDGSTEPCHESMLPMPVFNSRLLYVTARTPAGLGRVRLQLTGERTVAVERADGMAVLVRPAARWADDDEGRSAARRLAERLSGIEAGVRVGVSAAASAAGDLPRLLADARDAAVLADDANQVAVVDELWADVTLLRLRRNLSGCLAFGNPINALLARDEQAGRDTVHTMTVWLRHNRDTVTAAAELHLHPNTLRYRLRRVSELTGLDLDDPRQRLVVELLLAHA